MGRKEIIDYVMHKILVLKKQNLQKINFEESIPFNVLIKTFHESPTFFDSFNPFS